MVGNFLFIQIITILKMNSSITRIDMYIGVLPTTKLKDEGYFERGN